MWFLTWFKCWYSLTAVILIEFSLFWMNVNVLQSIYNMSDMFLWTVSIAHEHLTCCKHSISILFIFARGVNTQTFSCLNSVFMCEVMPWKYIFGLVVSKVFLKMSVCFSSLIKQSLSGRFSLVWFVIITSSWFTSHYFSQRDITTANWM